MDDTDIKQPPRRIPEIQVRDHNQARTLSAILAVLMAGSAGFVLYRAILLVGDQCAGLPIDPGLCTQPSSAWRALQFVLAVGAAATAAALVIWLGRFAWDGWTWRGLRHLGLAFSTLLVAWVVVFAVGAASL